MAENDSILHDLDQLHKGTLPANRNEEPRRYIGASGLRTIECAASLAYQARGFTPSFPDRHTARIWDTGKRLEQLVIDDLRDNFNWDIVDRTGDGNQLEFEIKSLHAKGHPDGICRTPNSKEWMILEIKTMHDFAWKVFANDGAWWKLKCNKSEHYPTFEKYWRQCQMLMGMSRIGKAVLVAINKDNSRYAVKLVEFDRKEYDWICGNLRSVIGRNCIKATFSHRTASEKPCSKCHFVEHCKKTDPDNQVIRTICAQCEWSVPEKGGKWWCFKKADYTDPDDTCGEFTLWEPERPYGVQSSGQSSSNVPPF